MENLKLIYKIAWSFNKTTGIDLDELISQASLAYSEALIHWNPEMKTKLSTYAWTTMQNNLYNFCQKEYRFKELLKNKPTLLPNTPNTVSGYQEPDEINEFVIMLKMWPEECQEIVKLILEVVEVFDDLPPKKARGKVVELLRVNGWSWSRIWENLNYIREILNHSEVGTIIPI